MKTFYCVIVVVLCLGTISSAQTNFIKNGGFESWTNSLPDNWITDTVSVSKITLVHGGSYALRLNTYLFYGLVAYPGMVSQYVPVTGTSFTLKGWYQLHSDSGDAVFVSILASKAGAYVGAGENHFTAAHSAYTAFAIGLEIMPNTSPDTCWLNIMMESDTTGKEHLSAYAIFDDLVLDNTVTGVRSDDFAHPSSYQLSQNYPNPFNPSTQIEFSVGQQQHVTLRVYNMLGQEVETLVDGQMPQGRYRRIFDGSGYASGTYLYILQAGTFMQVKRMALVK